MQLRLSHTVSIRTNKLLARFLYRYHFPSITALLFHRLRAPQIVNLFSYFRRLRLVSRFHFATVLIETKLLASCSPIAGYLAIRQLWGFKRQSELGHVFV